MNILENLLSTFKEILYDIIGYLLPGLFILFLIYVPFKLGHFYSFMYAIYEIIFKPEIDFLIDFLINPPKFSFISIFIIISLAYLLGHLPILISSLCKPIFKNINFLPKFIVNENPYKEFNINIRESLEKIDTFENQDINLDINYEDIDEPNKIAESFEKMRVNLKDAFNTQLKSEKEKQEENRGGITSQNKLFHQKGRKHKWI